MGKASAKKLGEGKENDLLQNPKPSGTLQIKRTQPCLSIKKKTQGRKAK